MNIKKSIALTMLLCGLFLMGLNVYGLFKDLRKEGLGTEQEAYIRFKNDTSLPYQDSINAIKQLALIKDPYDLLVKANQLVSKSITHVEWYRVDPIEYRQLVPVWENYLLFAVGKLSGLEFYERYHFVDYKKSIKRGIGVCGDASMILNQVLDQYGIKNDIIAFNGHVVVAASIGKQHYIADPDFGVIMPVAPSEVVKSAKLIIETYADAGYTEQDGLTLVNAYSSPFTVFDDVYHFISKRYLFEYAAYFIKWLLPILLLLTSVYLWRAANSKRK